MVKIILSLAAGLGMAGVGAYYLIKECGYDGGYFEEFLASIAVQLVFIGGICLALWGCGVFSMTLLWVTVAVSFLLPVVGVVLFRLPYWKRDRNKKNLRAAIMNGQKYRSFIAFLKKQGDRVGIIRDNGQVTYATGNEPLFVPEDNGYEVTWHRNPTLNTVGNGGKAGGWETIAFFNVREGERQWSYEEKDLIKELVREALPGGEKEWTTGYDEHSWCRKMPKTEQRRKRKDPY